MESAFSWLSQLIEAAGKLVPRLVIIRATHGGVKWRHGSNVKAMGPGLHWYWPLTTEVEIIVTARQTLAIPDQVLTTSDGKKIVVKTLVVYRIANILQAIGQQNWDVDTTINDLTQASIVRVVTSRTFSDILQGIHDATLTAALSHEVRRELRKFGVRVARCRLVDFAECKVLKLLSSSDKPGMATSQFLN